MQTTAKVPHSKAIFSAENQPGNEAKLFCYVWGVLLYVDPFQHSSPPTHPICMQAKLCTLIKDPVSIHPVCK